MSNKKSLSNIIVFIIIFIISLLMFEIVLRLFEINNAENLNKWIKTNDSRLYENKPNYEYSSNNINYKINNDGLRSNVDYKKYQKERFRIALVGDSVTFGLNVNINNTFGYLIEKKLNEKNNSFEIINFGVPGYDLISNVENIKIKGLDYNPDLILINFVMNDIEPTGMLFKENRDIEKKLCILPLIKLKVKCTTKDFLHKIKLINFFYEKLNNIFYKNVKDFYTVAWEDNDLYNKNILKPLNKFKKLCDENNLSCAVIIFPLLNFNTTYYKWQRYEDKLITDLKMINITHLSLTKPFQKYNTNDLVSNNKDMLHPNELGHEIAAEETVKLIKQIESNDVNEKK